MKSTPYVRLKLRCSQNGNWQSKSLCLFAIWTIALLALFTRTESAKAQGGTPATYNDNGGTELWTNPANWDPSSGYPNGSQYDATILAGKTVTSNTSITLNSITVQTGANVSNTSSMTLNQFLNSGTLNNSSQMTATSGTNYNILANNGTLTIGNVANNGVIIDSGPGSIYLYSNTVLSGSGSILMSGSSATLTLASGGTQSATHTIQGYGSVAAGSGTFTNNGLINANVSGQKLTLTPSFNPLKLTNNGILEASNGGTLAMVGYPYTLTITQTGTGQILANGGTVQFNYTNGVYRAQVIGGNLQTSSGGILSNTGFLDIIDVTNSGTFTNSGTLYIGGTNTNGITNNGIIVNSGSGNITFYDNATLNGTGSINMSGSNSTLSLASGIQSASHTIQGYGSLVGISVNGPFTNNGLINANATGQALSINASASAGVNMANSGTIEASNGGILSISGYPYPAYGVKITQTDAGQILASNSTVQFSNIVNVTGGILNTTGTGAMINSGSLGLTGVTNTGSFINQNSIYVLGTLTNSGTIYNHGEMILGNGTVLTGQGIFNLSGSNAYLWVMNLSTATLSGANIQVQGTASIFVDSAGSTSGTLVVNNRTGAYGAGNVLKITPDTTGTYGNNPYSGGTLVGSGTLYADSGGTLIIGGSNGGMTINTANIAAQGGNIQFVNSNTVKGSTLGTSGSGTITNFGTLYLGNVTLNGTLTNNGNIASSGTGFATVTNGSELSGTGTVTLSSGNAGIQQYSGSFTHDASHTISGAGTISTGGTFMNNGLINANIGSGTLSVVQIGSGNLINTGTLEASSQGILSLSDLITQTGAGQILANSGTVQLTGGTINNGTFNTINGGVISITGFGNPTLNSITNNGLFVSTGYSTLIGITNNGTMAYNGIRARSMISGRFTNNGTVNLNIGTLTFDSVAVLGGTGVIALSSANASITSLSGSFTQDASHSINGYGSISLGGTFFNNGLVNANVSGQTLAFSASGGIVNSGTLEASNGGVMAFNLRSLTEDVGGQLLASSGTIQFADSPTTINGGAFNTTDGGVISVSNQLTLNGVTNNGNVVSTGVINVSGTFVDNGNIAVTANLTPSTLSLANGTVLTGTGTVTLGGGPSYLQQFGANAVASQSATHTIQGFGAIDIDGTFINNGLISANVNGQNLNILSFSGVHNLTNTGTLIATNGGILNAPNVILANYSSGTLAGGTYEVDANSTMNLPGTIVSNAANVILNGTNSTFDAINSLASNSGTFQILGGRAFTTAGNLSNSGLITIGTSSALTVNGTYTQTGGQLVINGWFAANGGMTVSGGTVGGSGTMSAPVTVSAGASTYPGAGGTPTKTTMDLTYNAGSSAQFLIASSRTTDSPRKVTAGTDYDQIVVTGSSNPVLTIDPNVTLQLNMTSATLGTLHANAAGGATPYTTGSNTSLDNYYVFELGAGTSSGQFSTLTLDIDGILYTGTISYSTTNSDPTTGGNRFLSVTTGDVIITGIAGPVSIQEFAISYTGDYNTNSTIGGHDIVVTAVPEPGVWYLVAGGFLLLAVTRKFQRRPEES